MLPLEGVKVVEFCQVLAGPYCGMLLADMGADVVKIEPPDGDMMRQWPPIRDGYSENFASINRNKRSVVLDLKNPAHKAAARELILSADVVLENNRPGVMDRLGLGYESFAKEKPGLVYCSISAFGQSGPRSAEGGFDVTVQAMSGIMSVTGEPDGAPVKCGVPLSDFCAGLYAAYAIAAGNDGLWRATCKAVGLAELAADPRFASTTLRSNNQTALKEILEAEFARHTAAEMLAKFREAGVPCAPINTYSQALADEQVAHMGWVQDITLPSGKRTKTFGSPLRFSGKGFDIRRDPPALGQHNDEVFGAVTAKESA